MGSSGNYVREKDHGNSISSIQGETLEKINEQMKKSSCKIENEKGNGSGFFCLIPFPDKANRLPVLMTNNHVLPKEDIMKDKIINICMNNHKFSIYIDESRKTYTNEKYDITIIEINIKDKLDINTFLEIDDSIYKENPYEYLKARSIYLIHYPKSSNNPEFAVGKIKYLTLDTKTIEHTCTSEFGSSGSPILDLKTNKILGIHKGAESNKKMNVGTFIKEPIEIFYEEYKNKLSGIENKNKIEENEIKKIDNNVNNYGNNNKNNNNNNNILINKNDNLNENIINNKVELDSINLRNSNKIDKNKSYNEFCLFNNDNNYNNDNENNQEKKNLNEINPNQLNGKNDINNNSLNENIINNINNYMIDENDDIDEITIKYKKTTVNVFDILLKIQLYGIKETSSNDKLFGENFVNDNKHLCKIIIGNKEFELKSYLNKESDEVNKNEFEIKLKGISRLTSLSCMFCGCLSLDSIIGFEKINTKNMTSFSFLFGFCKISSIPDISKWDTRNVTNMNQMFVHCFHLKSIPDISKWNTSNLMYINNLFTDCYSLEFLPDISKWNTNNLEKMEKLFAGCKNLKFLPDISKWKTNKVSKMNELFSGCSSLINFPDISKWETNKVSTMEGLFQNCYSLINLPDISKWDTSNVFDMSNMFDCCFKLYYLL